MANKKQPAKHIRTMAKSLAYYLRRDGQTYETVAQKVKETYGWDTSKQTIAAWFNRDGSLKDEKKQPVLPMKPVTDLSEVPGYVKIDIETCNWEEEFKLVMAGHIEAAKYCFHMAHTTPDPKDRIIWASAAGPHTTGISKLLQVLSIGANDSAKDTDDPMKEYKSGFIITEAEDE